MPNDLAAELETTPHACVNCGNVHSGDFCNRCGQRVQTGPYTTRRLLRQAVGHAFDVDRGFLHTALALSVRPGATVREYLSGRTAPYADPLRYLLVVVAAATLLSVAPAPTPIIQIGGSPEVERQIRPLNAFIVRYANVLLAAAVPCLAVATKLLYRRARLTFGEHLVLGCYLVAQATVIYLVFIPLMALLPEARIPLMRGYFVVASAYVAWGAWDFFGPRSVRGVPTAALAAIVTNVLYVALFGAVVAAVLFVLLQGSG